MNAFIALALAIICTMHSAAAAQSLEPETLRRKQEDQQRARTMTRELLGNVLDLQLRQLEENGLQDLPVYRDIQLMRGNLQHVVDAEMKQVVDRLAAAQRQPAAERERSFVEARKMIRTVVVRLSAERQSLLRRLKVAELAEQVHRLIRLQTDVQAVVKAIPSEAATRRESLALKAREDQGDVKGLFFPLVETLDDVRTWGGPMAAVCQDGLRVLQAAEVGKHLDAAETELVAAKYVPTAEHQDGALKGLRELLKLLEKTQGMLAAENRAVLDRIRALAEKQEAVRDATRKLDPNEPPPSPLVEQQSAIQNELADLERSLPVNPTAERLLDQAENAAKDATSDLFDVKTNDALTEQGQVLGNLAALEQMLETGAPEASSDKTAAELAALVDKLSSVKEQLQQAEAKSDAAEQQAEQNAAAAAPLEQQAAELIADAAKSTDLPDAVAAPLKRAEAAARSAQDALARATGPATQPAKEMLDRAEETLDRAQAAVEAALKDAQSQAAAVQIGELARAAEALERAAAEERDVAAAAKALPTENAQAAAAELAARQGEVADIAKKVAEALTQTSPHVGQQVAEAAERVTQSQQQLAQAVQQPMAGQQAAQTAQQAAKDFSQAAKQLRSQVGDIAEALATQSGKQAAELSDAREGVEQAMNDAIGSLSERMTNLEAAAAKTYSARMEQQRASGRPEAAAAMKLTEQIAQALDAQIAADAEGDAADPNSPAAPVKAIAQQQAVAEMAQQAGQAAKERAAAKAKPSADPLSQALDEAQKQAAKAAKAMLDGQSQAADQSRKAAFDALRQATELALAEANAAMQAAPTAAPDLAAQRAAQSTASVAEPLAATDAPAAAKDLNAAQQSAGEAVQALVAQQPQRATAPQQQTEQTLQSAQQQIHSALQDLARQQTEMLNQQAEQAGQLADRAAALDPDATAALDAAAEAAGEPAPPSPAAQMSQAKSAEKQLERAAATLAAKEQRVRRDEAVAKALAALAEQQQAAAEMLEQQRGLAEAMGEPRTGDTPEVNTDEAAAAAEEFADAQRATGQGAVEISGQTQVANPPLRAALQQAAALPSARQAQSMAQLPGQAPPAGEQQPGSTPAPAGESTNDDVPGELQQAAGQPGGQKAEASADAGFVPQSPETTAQLMAGPQLTRAMQAAQQAAQQLDPNARANAKPSNQPADPSSATKNTPTGQAATNSSQATPQGVQPGQEQKNAAVKDDVSQAPNDKPDPSKLASGTRQGDAEQSLRKLQDQPWFAKLPPELRKSIGAGAQQKGPRAYEERLRRYFQSVD